MAAIQVITTLLIVFVFMTIVEASEISCPESTEESSLPENNMAWICEFLNYRNTLAEWKERIERECVIGDVAERWQSLFSCPDFSNITCLKASSLDNEIDLFNCSIIFCKDGRYSGQKSLFGIWRRHFYHYKIIMAASKLIQCRPSDCTESTTPDSKSTAGQTTTPEPTTTPDPTTTAEAMTTSPGPDWQKSGDRFYKCFNDVRRTYQQAKDNCASFGGRLAVEVLGDPVVASYIATNCFKFAGYAMVPWVGFYEIVDEGKWVWTDGGTTNPDNTEWDRGQPDNKGGIEDCGHIYGVSINKLFLNDARCDFTATYICEV